MIIKGGARSNGVQLGQYLLAAGRNEHIEVLDVRHGETDDLQEALRYMQEMTATGQRGTKGLYHAQISPAPGDEMDREAWMRAADVLGRELGLDDQARAIVIHTHGGRDHAHVVWQRTDAESLSLRSDSWNYIAHERAARHIEIELGHERVEGVHTGEAERAKSFDREQAAQAERSRFDPRELRAAVTQAWQQSDSGQAFRHALDEMGLEIARGDRRGYVLVDPAGEAYSLSRQVEGVRAREIKDRLGDIDDIPTVSEAREKQEARQEDRASLPASKESPPEKTEGQGREWTDPFMVGMTMARDRRNLKKRQLIEQHEMEDRHSRQLGRFDDQAARQERAAQKADPAPGFFRSAWLKLRGKYETVMQEREQLAETRQEAAELARQRLLAAQAEEARRFREGQKLARQRMEDQQETRLEGLQNPDQIREHRRRVLEGDNLTLAEQRAIERVERIEQRQRDEREQQRQPRDQQPDHGRDDQDQGY